MMAGHESMLKEALSDFLRKHSAEEAISGIDEIVLLYMVSILEDLGIDSSADEGFDLDGFIEMMEAYLPGFSSVDSSKVCEWVFELAARLRDGDGKARGPASLPQMIPRTPEKSTSSAPESTLAHKYTSKGTIKEGKQRRSRRSSEREAQCAGAEAVPIENGFHDDSDEVQLLMEMFPASCVMEVSHCLTLSHGNLESAAQLILHRQEAGESINATPPKPHRQSSKKVGLSDKEGDNLKKSIISKYSYVDMDEDKKEHRPVMPKYAGKKLTRYLDNKVVSTKGEKFTEIKKDDDDEQKKTVVNLKPARQYRFH